MTLALGVVGVGPAAAARRSSTPASWDSRIKPIAEEVEKLRDLDFEHPVAAEFLDDAKFEKRVQVDKGKLTKSDKADIERSQGQLRSVGLIGPDVDIIDATSSLQSSGVLAYYSPKTKKITVKGTNLDDIDMRVTVAHELTHALQDQHFDLQKLEKAATKHHGSTALRTLIEGDAVRIQNDYVDSLSASDKEAYETQSADASRQARDEIEAKGVPDSLTVFFEAPYALGQPMLDAVIGKESESGIDALFKDPPTADAAYVTPSTVLDHRTFQHVKTPALQEGEKRSGKPDVFGSLALFQVLASRIDNATALSAADAWDGDAMITFSRTGTTCLRATFAGRGTQGKGTIADALNRWAAEMPSGSAKVVPAHDRVTLTTCDPGSAATEVANQPLASLIYLSTRDGLFAELIKSGASTEVATCSSDTVVRDPVFAPLLDASANDPSAEPDDELIGAVRSRVSAIVADCLRSTRT